MSRLITNARRAASKAYSFLRRAPEWTVGQYLVVSEPALTFLSVLQLALRACSIVECCYVVAKVIEFSLSDDGYFSATERIIFSVNAFYTALYLMLAVTEILFSRRAVAKESASDLMGASLISLTISSVILAEEIWIRRSQASKHAHTHTHTRTHAHTHTRTHAHTRTRAHAHAHTHSTHARALGPAP